MKIIFNKTVGENEIPDQFLTWRERLCTYKEGLGKVDFTRVECDESAVQKDFVSKIEKSLQGRNFKTTRSANNTLWVSEPEEFSLSVYTSRTGKFEREKTGTREKQRNGFFRIVIDKIPQYREVPIVKLEGNLHYEALEGINPVPAIDALNEVGFATRVITTPEEIYETLEKIKRAKSESRRPLYTRNRLRGSYDPNREEGFLFDMG